MSNFSRWFNYAKARLDAAIGQGHRDLDELEAQREAELADKPWLASSGDTPTFDEARARIQYEAEQAAREASGADRPTDPDVPSAQTPNTDPVAAPTAPPRPEAASGNEADPGAEPARITSPEERAAAAEAASARLELEARERESAARLDAIRAELGIEPIEGD